MSPPDRFSDDPDREPGGPGGPAGERRRQFEEERGLSDGRELDLEELDEPEDEEPEDEDD